MSTAVFTTLQAPGGTVPTETLRRGAVRAWGNFNQTGTQVLRDSFNVSSILDSGVGLTDISMTTAFANSNYITNGGGSSDNVTNNCYTVFGNQPAGLKTTSLCRFALVNAAGSAADAVEPCFSFNGGFA